MLRRMLSLLLIAAVAAPLAACGKKGLPEAPEGNTFPRGYPEGAPRDPDPYDFLNRNSGRRGSSQ